jgi:hypothetical protein
MLNAARHGVLKSRIEQFFVIGRKIMSESITEVAPLTYDILKGAVAGVAAAIRCRLILQPAAGEGTKVFPPTHSGGVYATEQRRLPVKNKPVKRKLSTVFFSTRSKVRRTASKTPCNRRLTTGNSPCCQRRRENQPNWPI